MSEDKEKDMKMRNRIREYRLPYNLSQHRLGKKVGVSRISINKIENGKTIPSLSLAHRIAEAVNASIYEIFDLDGSGDYEYKKRKDD